MPRKKAEFDRGQQKRRGEARVAALKQEGRSKEEIFNAFAQENVAHIEKTAVQKGKCLNCWQSARNGVCICSDLLPVPLTVPVNILVWFAMAQWHSPETSSQPGQSGWWWRWWWVVHVRVCACHANIGIIAMATARSGITRGTGCAAVTTRSCCGR